MRQALRRSATHEEEAGNKQLRDLAGEVAACMDTVAQRLCKGQRVWRARGIERRHREGRQVQQALRQCKLRVGVGVCGVCGASGMKGQSDPRGFYHHAMGWEDLARTSAQ